MKYSGPVRIKDEPFILVFVHFGPETPDTLATFARAGLNRNKFAIPILISERYRPELDFPGETILYKSFSEASKRFKRVNRHYTTMASGYWAHTFDRIFALSALKDRFPDFGVPVVHLESDVLPLFDKEELAFLKESFDGVAVPRYSQSRGIGSILYSPSISKLRTTLERLNELALEKMDFLENDMQLLGQALNSGLIQELPSHPSDHFGFMPDTTLRHMPLFDGAALGQYLFGRDPFHQHGLMISGFVNPEYAERTDVTDFVWRCDPKEDYVDLVIGTRSGTFKVSNLHVHSKELLPELSDNSERWVRAIREANHEQMRISEVSRAISPHSRNATPYERILIARRKGFWRTAYRYLRKRIL